jgi:hypothetical protein
MGEVELRGKLYELERKVSDLEWKLHRTASNAHWELANYRSHVQMVAVGTLGAMLPIIVLIVAFALR